MNAVTPISETADTVTLRRADFQRMLDALDDAADRTVVAQAEAREAGLGVDVARADHLPVELAERLLDGEHPVRVWRLHRGLSVQALAADSGVARSYVAEIEGGQKPGSIAALRKLAAGLGVTVDDLLPAKHAAG